MWPKAAQKESRFSPKLLLLWNFRLHTLITRYSRYCMHPIAYQCDIACVLRSLTGVRISFCKCYMQIAARWYVFAHAPYNLNDVKTSFHKRFMHRDVHKRALSRFVSWSVTVLRIVFYTYRMCTCYGCALARMEQAPICWRSVLAIFAFVCPSAQSLQVSFGFITPLFI